MKGSGLNMMHLCTLGQPTGEKSQVLMMGSQSHVTQCGREKDQDEN